MSTNYNQLLKDLEIGSVYVKILICFLGCTFMLYPFLCYFTHFFRELSVYEQIFFTLGSSALYLGQISCLFLYSHDIVNLCHCDMYFYIFIGGFFFSASIIMHSTVFRISVSHYHRGNSRFQREKDF